MLCFFYGWKRTCGVRPNGIGIGARGQRRGVRPVLILDVARYEYRPAWATASERFNAMNTTDADAGDKTRGFALVSKTGS